MNGYHHWIPGEILRGVGSFLCFDHACFAESILGCNRRRWPEPPGPVVWFLQEAVKARVAVSHDLIGWDQTNSSSLQVRLVPQGPTAHACHLDSALAPCFPFILFVSLYSWLTLQRSWWRTLCLKGRTWVRSQVQAFSYFSEFFVSDLARYTIKGPPCILQIRPLDHPWSQIQCPASKVHGTPSSIAPTGSSARQMGQGIWA